ncbi:MAG: hypothetical protein IT435_07905 [Phycisphaerales bacterium]|nr:hypothetical protein [Phycisphaerales bacterium]
MATATIPSTEAVWNTFFHEVFHTIRLAQAALQLRLASSSEEVERRYQLMLPAGQFFDLLCSTLPDAAILRIRRLADPPEMHGGNHKQFCIDYAVSELGIDLDRPELVRLKEQIHDFKRIAKKLEPHRNKRIVHNDLQTTLSRDWSNLGTISCQDIQTVCTLLNSIAEGIGRNHVHGEVCLADASERTGVDSLLATLEDCAWWRRIRTEERDLSDAEIRRTLRRGLFDDRRVLPVQQASDDAQSSVER